MNFCCFLVDSVRKVTTTIISCSLTTFPLLLCVSDPSTATPRYMYETDYGNNQPYEFSMSSGSLYMGTVLFYDVLESEPIPLPPVEIIGNRIYPDEFQRWLEDMQTRQDILMMDSLNRLMQLAGTDNQLVANLDPRKDVRCSSNQTIRQTTSQSGDPEKYLAAVDMFRTYFLPTVPVLNYKSLMGKSFTVTYSDGGTITWTILDPRMSPPLNEIPTAISSGNGVPQTSPVCPKIG